MKKQWNIPTLEVLDVKKTFEEADFISCIINPKLPWCKPQKS